MTYFHCFFRTIDGVLGLPPIVIDGPNVAFCHGKDKVFSAKGIKLVIEYFKMRGHQKIVAYVPELWRKSEETLDPQVLEELYDQDVVVFTPSVSYVDMYRVIFLTGPPHFQYQNEKTCSANEELFYIKNFLKR